MKLKLADTIYSQQDLQTVAAEIQEYARWFAHNAIKQRLNVKHVAPEPAISPAAKTLLRDAAGKQRLSQTILDELIATLDDYKNTAPQLTITLAAPPPNGLKQKLVAWCRDNVAPNVLVNFQFNSAILGGLVVRLGSRVLDWSFRRQILENRGHFPEVLRNV